MEPTLTRFRLTLERVFSCQDRRQLTTGQRAMVAAKMANMRHGGDRKSDQSANLHIDHVTQTEAAIKLNVSPRLVADAKTIQRESPELAKQVEAGTITVNAAKELIKDVHLALAVLEALQSPPVQTMPA